MAHARTHSAQTGPTGPANADQSFVSTSLAHPRLDRLDTNSIRTFLCEYDAYCKEVTARAQQLLTEDSVSIEPVHPVSIKFCIDTDQLEYAIDLGFNPDVTDFEDLSKTVLDIFLDQKAEECKITTAVSNIDALIVKELRTDMPVKSARSRMGLLFMAYSTLLSRHGLKWVKDSNPEMAVGHVVSVIKLQELHKNLQSDLDPVYKDLRKDFKRFMAFALNISDAFEKVDIGPTNKDQKKGNKGRHGNGRTGGGGASDRGTSPPARQSDKTAKSCGPPRQPPLYTHPPCKPKDMRH